MTRRPKKVTRVGMSLIEVAIATSVLGIGVAALMVSTSSSTSVNDAGTKLNQAVFLAQEIREWTLGLSFVDPEEPNNPPGAADADYGNPDDLDDLMDSVFSPPKDGAGWIISDLPNWSQTITLSWRDTADLASTVPDGTSDAVYVQVAIACRGDDILTTGWLVLRR